MNSPVAEPSRVSVVSTATSKVSTASVTMYREELHNTNIPYQSEQATKLMNKICLNHELQIIKDSLLNTTDTPNSRERCHTNPGVEVFYTYIPVDSCRDPCTLILYNIMNLYLNEKIG